MRAAVTISLPPDLLKKVDRLAKKKGIGRSDFIREAINRYIWQMRFEELRENMKIQARKNGIFTEEDVFKEIS
ncbi:MAG: CopG family ribbon-helix-helix protein [Thermodesulfobacteriota bacterium]